MSDYTPTREQIIHAYCDGLAGTSRTREESRGEVERGIAAIEREAAARALAEVRSTIGAYQENGVWAFDQAVACIERARAAEIREGQP